VQHSSQYFNLLFSCVLTWLSELSFNSGSSLSVFLCFSLCKPPAFQLPASKADLYFRFSDLSASLTHPLPPPPRWGQGMGLENFNLVKPVPYYSHFCYIYSKVFSKIFEPSLFLTVRTLTPGTPPAPCTTSTLF
jgi:hypothetical protein